MSNHVKKVNSNYNTNQTTTKTKRIREIFNLEEKVESHRSKGQKSYNQEVFFKDAPSMNRDQISQLISEIINNSSSTLGKDNIKFKVNINNNFYNANIDLIINSEKGKQQISNTNNIQPIKEETKKDESSGIGSFFSIVLITIGSLFGMHTATIPNTNSNTTTVTSMTKELRINTEVTDTVVSNPSPQDLPKTIFKPSKPSNNPIDNIYIPCLNCNELIPYHETESHSAKCVKVKEEVLKIESSQYSFHVVDYRLKKLQEHLINLKNVNPGLEMVKDSHYFSSIFKYIEDALECQKINHSSITALKKIITNVETLIINFKGSISTLILIERTKVIIIQKIKILREDLRKNYDTFQSNQLKSGEFSEFKRSTNELESIKEQMLRESIKIETEKDMIKRKISNFRNTLSKDSSLPKTKQQGQIDVTKSSIIDNSMVDKSRISVVSKSEQHSPNKRDYINSEYHTKNQDCQNEHMLNNSKNLTLTKKFSLETDDDFEDNEAVSVENNFVNEINSDVEQNCLKTEYSDGTSISSVNSISSGFSSEIASPKNKARLTFLRQRSKEDEEEDSRPNTVGVHNNGKPKNSKALYREFVKVFLKIKFEKLDNDHIGQKISQNSVWEEVQKQNIPKEKWKDFILNELKNYKKYDKKKEKKFKTMDVIDEEL